MNKIIHGCCVDIMKGFPDNYVDMSLTSPPYDNLRNYKGYSFNFENVAKELYRVLKDGSVLVWVVGDSTINGSETGTSFKQCLFFKEIGFNLHDTMIFRKKNPIPQIYRKRYTNEFDYMFVFSKGTVKTHNPIMVDCNFVGTKPSTYKNYSKNNQIRNKKANPVKDKKIRGNIWEYSVGVRAEDKEAKGHSAPFPMELARDHIQSWTNEGDLVLDPMCGSGTTCKAAVQLNRSYVGIDISKDYCSLAIERISNKD